MGESDVASLTRLIASLDQMLKIAEKNPISFNIETLQKSRETALRMLEDSKIKYRNTLKFEAELEGESRDDVATLKKYRF
ncbi:MAG TPA: hypothetical protein VKM55_14495 [Candidatus Lokiarchaeia archaeon]|nr:hypothetical protein [Candidatus Lokiarchaeia archaeon]